MDEELRERCEAYASGLFAPESDAQRWIRAELDTRGLPAIQVSALEGRFLAVLARSVDARRVLEIGTLAGYSALWLLSLLRDDARLVTIEKEPAHAELAREAFRRAGVADRAEVRVGDAHRVLEDVASEPPFDFLFIDADKPGYPEYLERGRSLVRPGGLLTADNALWEGRVTGPEEGDDEATRGIRTFNRRLAEDPAFEGVIVPIRDGVAVARRAG